jgi:hypothetical protein
MRWLAVRYLFSCLIVAAAAWPAAAAATVPESESAPAPAVPAGEESVAQTLHAGGLSLVPVRGTDVDPGAGTGWIEAVLASASPGQSGLPAQEIVVTAVRGSAGEAVLLAALHDLRRTPLVHTVRVLLFEPVAGDSAPGLSASELAVESRTVGELDAILAVVHLDLLAMPPTSVGERSPPGRSERPLILPLPSPRAAGAGGRHHPPGWLVHAALRGFQAADWPAAVAHRQHPMVAQLVLRLADPARAAPSQPWTAAGVPALALSDVDWQGVALPASVASSGFEAEALQPWPLATAAVVRRLDALAGRPRGEESYLALAGRVWLRRDLYWVGFLLWGALVILDRRRAGALSPSGGGAGGRPQVVAFRFALLVAWMVAPVLAAALLSPAVVLALLPPRWRRPPALRAPIANAITVALALAPATCLLAVVWWASVNGAVTGWAPVGLPMLLVAVALAAGVARLAAPAP